MVCVEEEFKKGERLGGRVTVEIKWGKSKKEKPSIMINSGGIKALKKKKKKKKRTAEKRESVSFEDWRRHV
jgi:hypothetical protein